MSITYDLSIVIDIAEVYCRVINTKEKNKARDKYGGIFQGTFANTKWPVKVL